MATILPSQPSLVQLRHQAKDLLKAHERGERSACRTLRHLKHLAQLSEEQILGQAVSLQEAQHALAQEYGFESWTRLKEAVESAARPAPGPAVAGAAMTPEGTIQELLAEAIRRRASDVHLDWRDGRMAARMRIDGALQQAETGIDRTDPLALIATLKTRAGMNAEERRLPQDGRMAFRPDGRSIVVRVSTMPYVGGESAVMRLMGWQQVPSLDQIGLPAEDLARLRSWMRRPHGLIVITGPTGCGKSATAYAMLGELNDGSRRIVTVEDPVEATMEGVHQQQVDPPAGLGFAAALRSLARQDPDVLFVGELRDRETLSGVLQAAVTGHLVITILHASDGANAVRRLLDLEGEPHLISSSLIGVVSQRLVRKVCDGCRAEVAPDPSLAERLREFGSTRVARGSGCEACQGRGYRGRTGVYELLEVDDGLRRAIGEKGDTKRLTEGALGTGLVPLRRAALRLVAAGVTSPEEAMGMDLF